MLIIGLLYYRGDIAPEPNLDSIIIAAKPKMSPHIEKMRKNLASALKISTEQVSIKATTTESLGFIGREEGIAAQAIVLLHSIN